MVHLIGKTLLILGISMAATTLHAAPLSTTDAKKPARAKAKNSKSKVKLLAGEEGSTRPGTPEDEPEIKDNKVVQFNCELGASIAIYTNEADSEHLALRWKKRLHRLTRVGTTTGANRFENTNFGLVWIGIPAKGMLLDSRMNHQLANECKSLEQEALAAQPVSPAPITEAAAPSPAAPVGVITLPDTAVPAVPGVLVAPTVPGAVLLPPVSGAPVVPGTNDFPPTPADSAIKPLFRAAASEPATVAAQTAPTTPAPAPVAAPSVVVPTSVAAPPLPSAVAPPAVATPPMQPAAVPAVTAPSVPPATATVKPPFKAAGAQPATVQSTAPAVLVPANIPTVAAPADVDPAVKPAPSESIKRNP
ncbi:MAG: hypothetical protein ACJ8GW_01140 [Massilia sp.]